MSKHEMTKYDNEGIKQNFVLSSFLKYIFINQLFMLKLFHSLKHLM